MNATALDYHGKTLIVEPINMPLSDIGARLRGGHTVVAQLEPGDGTHYCLLIVPAWSEYVMDHLGRYGIRPSTANEYLLITQLNDTGGSLFYAFAPGAETWDMHGIKNEWTREVFRWFTTHLWEAIQHAQKI